MLKLIRINRFFHKRILLDFLNDWIKSSEKIYPFSIQRYLNTGDINKFFKELKKEGNEDYIGITYFLYDTDKKKIVGACNIKKNLSEKNLIRAGHIATGIAPSFRGKGFGNKLVELAICKAKEIGIKEIFMTAENEKSRKTIEFNGGKFLEEIYLDGFMLYRYKF
jgi:predicted acetyltransferase